MGSLLEISNLEFPILLRDIQSTFKPFFLFLFGNVKENFDDGCTFVDEHFFEISDVSIPFLNELFWRIAMNFDHKNIFVVTAIKDSNFSICWNARMDAPEVVVCQFTLSRFLE
jgi:hypothetical protein